jgi:hypothetical protein
MFNQEVPFSPTQVLTVYQTALAAYHAGISVLPIPPDGTKCPKLRWGKYRQRRATIEEMTAWFHHTGNGIALITGSVSGGLEVLDFDTPEIYWAWDERMRQEGWAALSERISQGYLEASPNGMHLLYRCSELVEGNQKKDDLGDTVLLSKAVSCLQSAQAQFFDVSVRRAPDSEQ